MVRRLVEGSTNIAGLTDPGATQLRRAVVRDHIEHLATVHTLDWQQYGLGDLIPAPASPAEALKHDLDIWKDIWFKGRTASFPLMTEAIYWLEENLPTDSPRISLVKGNNGVGEEIFRNNRIVAMSDWELASLSDGVLDIGFSQGTLTLDSFEDAVRYYGECAGAEVSPQRLAFGTFMIMFKTMVCLDTTFVRYCLEGTDTRIASPAFALTVRQMQRRFAYSIGKDIVTALFDMGNPHRKSAYAEIGATE